MTIGNNKICKCDLCGNVLEEGGQDVRELSHPYEFPYEIKWDGTECTITNKVVKHICAPCLDKVMGTIKNLIW